MSNQQQIQVVEQDTNTKLEQPSHFIQSQLYDLADEDDHVIALHNILIKYVPQLKTIVNSPQKNEFQKLKLIKKAMNEVDFEEIIKRQAHQHQQSDILQLSFSHDQEERETHQQKKIETLQKQQKEYKRKEIEEQFIKLVKEQQIDLNNIPVKDSLVDYYNERINLNRRQSANQQAIRLQLETTYQQEIKKLKEEHEKTIQDLRQNHAKEIEALNLTISDYEIKQHVELQDKIIFLERQAVQKDVVVVLEQQKNIKLHEELKSKNETIVVQSNRLIEQSEQINRLHANIHDLQSNKHELQHKLAQKDEIVRQLQKDKQQLIKIIQKKEFENSLISQQIHQNHQQINILKRDQSAYKNQISQYLTEKQVLQYQIQALQQYKIDYTEKKLLQNKILILQQQKTEYSEQRERLRHEIKQLQEFRANHSQNLRNSQQEIARLTQKINEISAETVPLTQKIIQMRAQIARLTQRINQLRAELETPPNQMRVFQQITAYVRTLQPAQINAFKNMMIIHIGGIRNH